MRDCKWQLWQETLGLLESPALDRIVSWLGTFGSSCWCVMYLCGCNLHQQNIMVKMLGVILIFFPRWFSRAAACTRKQYCKIIGCLMASHDTDGHNNSSVLSCRLAYKRYAWRTYCKGLPSYFKNIQVCFVCPWFGFTPSPALYSNSAKIANKSALCLHPVQEWWLGGIWAC